MTRDQRFWRLLTLVEDYYTTGERTAGDPPAVRFPGAPAPGATPANLDPAPPEGAASSAARGDAAAPPTADQAAGAADSLARVAVEVAACRACRLCAGRTNTVPGEGASQVLVMVVGEGPGREEDRSGRPFVGPAGQYLDRWLAAIDLQRDANCFITNVVKCRPPDNRDPLPDESSACLPFLQRQIRLLRPRALLSVGRIASQVLTGRDAPIGALRGQVYHYAVAGSPQPLPLVTTYHPSGVLRNQSLRRAVWDDLRLLQRVIAADGDSAAETSAAAPG